MRLVKNSLKQLIIIGYITALFVSTILFFTLKLDAISISIVLLSQILFASFFAFIADLKFIRPLREQLQLIIRSSSHLFTSSEESSQSKLSLSNIPSFSRIIEEAGIQLNEAKRKEKLILDNVADVICVLDTSTRFLQISSSVNKNWGYSKKEILGKRLEEFLTDDKKDETLNLILASERSIQKVIFENKLKTKSGKIIDLLWSAHWSISDSGLFCIAQDISEFKQAEELKREFLAMVSHDLQTPLTSIYSALKFIEQGKGGELNKKGQELNSIALKEAKRVNLLVKDLLDLERMRSGKFSLNFNYCNLMDTILEAQNSLKTFSESRNIAILLTESTESIINCYYDKQRIMQVLYNLIENAIKYSKPNTEITISTNTQNLFVQVSVQNFGQVIAQDELQTIFEKFERGPNETAAMTYGSGLGLTICKSIIEQHGGKIEVSSSEESGTIFVFTIAKDKETLEKMF